MPPINLCIGEFCCAPAHLRTWITPRPPSRGRLRRAALARSLPAALAAALALLPAPPVMAVNGQPITIKGDTTAAGNHCTALPGSDLVFQISVPCDGLWTFSVDDGDVWKSVVSVGTTSCGSQLGVGATGKLSVSFTAGTYFLTVDGNTASDEGGFLLQVFLALPPSTA